MPPKKRVYRVASQASGGSGGQRAAPRRVRYSRALVTQPTMDYGAIPQSMKTRITFCSVKTIQGVIGGVVTQWAFKGNSVYDPDPALGGGQPQSFDQLMLLYTDWRCYGSKCRVTCIPASTALNPGPITFNLVAYRASGLTLPSAGQLEEISTFPNSKELICTPRGGSRDIGRLTSSMTNKAFFAGQNPNAAAFQGSSAADAPQIWYWIISAYNSNQAGDATGNYSCGISVMITYDMEFFSPRQNVDS